MNIFIIKRKIVYLFSLSVMLSSCASNTGIVSLGQNKYLIAKQQATGFPGLGNMKAEIISDGIEYCKKAGKEFEILSSKETEGPYIFGKYPRSEIEFTCK